MFLHQLSCPEGVSGGIGQDLIGQPRQFFASLMGYCSLAAAPSPLLAEEFFQDIIHIEQQGDGSAVRAGIRHGGLLQVGDQFSYLIEVERMVNLDGVAARHHD